MTNTKPIKGLDAPSQSEPLGVDHYRDRYRQLIARFKNFKQMVIEVGQLDPELSGYDGIILLIGVNNGRRGLKPTARIVSLMEKLRPDETKPTAPKSRLSRQKLEKVPASR